MDDPHHRLADAFYAQVARDSVLRPLYVRNSRREVVSLDCPARVLGDWFHQFFGAAGSSQRHWWLSLRDAHQRFRIKANHRDAWLADMGRALDECKTEEPARSAYLRFFERTAEWLVTADDSLLARELDTADSEIAWRWDGLRTLESCVAAVRQGDFERALALLASPLLERYFQHDRASYLGLLALMSTTPLQDVVRERLAADPGIAREQYGPTLLHEVAGLGCPAIVDQLLRLGADPDAVNQAGHTPLYTVGNAGGGEHGPAVVRLLAAAGANLNAQENAKRCTALHMAARRGNVLVAEALLDCGADIEARDIAGETPLRRAVNCRKSEVTALLLARGANPHAPDRKGITPAMKLGK